MEHNDSNQTPTPPPRPSATITSRRKSVAQSSIISSVGSPPPPPPFAGLRSPEEAAPPNSSSFEYEETVFRYDNGEFNNENNNNNNIVIEEEEIEESASIPSTSPPSITASKARFVVAIKPPTPTAFFRAQQLSPPQPIPLRNPTLSELINFLMHWSGLIRSNAAAYLAHLCYTSAGDSSSGTKVEARAAIPILIELLVIEEEPHDDVAEFVSSAAPSSSPAALTIAQLQQYKNFCCALRNLTHDDDEDDDENKRMLLNSNGVSVLARLYAHVYAQQQTAVKGVVVQQHQHNLLSARNDDDRLGTFIGQQAEVCEIVAAIFCNLSRCEDLKKPLASEALRAISATITDLPTAIIDLLQHQQQQEEHEKFALYDYPVKTNQTRSTQNLRAYNQQLLRHFQTKTFRFISGVLRNVSSVDDEQIRKVSRGGEDGGVFLRAIFAYLRIVCATSGTDGGEEEQQSSSKEGGIINSKSTENCVCMLRNISYRLQEVDDATYDEAIFRDGVGEVVYNRKNHFHHHHSAKEKKIDRKNVAKTLSDALSTSTGDEAGVDDDDDDIFGPDIIFSLRTPKTPKQKAELSLNAGEVLPSAAAARQVDILWSHEAVKTFLALLRQCTNPVTLEAAAGALQNLTACAWRPTTHVRALVRKERGLPILIELLRMENDRTVCTVARALRNLALDEKNRDLIGKYAMNDLMAKIPAAARLLGTSSSGAQAAAHTQSSDETVAAILATLNEVVASNQEFARIFVEHDGLAKLVRITHEPKDSVPKVYGPKTVRFTMYILHVLWRRHVKLRDLYKTFGFKESQLLYTPKREHEEKASEEAAEKTRRKKTIRRERTKSIDVRKEVFADSNKPSSLLAMAAQQYRRQTSAEEDEEAARLLIAPIIVEPVDVDGSDHTMNDDGRLSPPRPHNATRHQYSMATQ